MFKENTLRNVALGVVRKDNKILVEKGYDKVKEIEFYRCIGGGIEVFETPMHAQQREIKKELNVDITLGRHLPILDSKFVYNGKEGHEIVFNFEVEIPKKQLKDKYVITDNGITSYAEWIDIEEFKSGNKTIYPEGTVNFL